MKKQGESFTKADQSRQRKSKSKRAIIIIFSFLLVFTIIVGASFLFVYHKGKSNLRNDQGMDSFPTGDTDTPPENVDGRTIIYKGSTYQLNDNLVTILFMGTDNYEPLPDSSAPGNNGQADALFILAVDTDTGQTDVIGISRDSMVDIDIFALDGGFVKTARRQVCLAYAYGDGREKSCENVSRSVSRLLFGMPIKYYCAIDLRPIGIFNDAVGGVKVSALEDIKLSGGLVKKGESVVLKGEDARHYVQYRDTVRLDSNNPRIKRQQQYLTAFAQKALSMTKKDVTLPVKMYNKFSKYITTNLKTAEISYLTSNILKNNDKGEFNFRIVKGDVVQGEKFAEYVVDETALYELILEVFYNKIA